MQEFKILDGMGNPVCYTQAKDSDEVEAVTGMMEEDAPPMAVCPVDLHPHGAQMVALKGVRSFMEEREAQHEVLSR